MNDLISLCQDLPESSFNAGESVIVQGDSDPKLVVLKSGRVEILRGALRVATADEPGSIFGEISVILRTPHSATVKTLSPSVCYVISNPDTFLWQNAELHFELMRVLARRLVAVDDSLVELSRRSEAQDEAIEIIVRRIEESMHRSGSGKG